MSRVLVNNLTVRTGPSTSAAKVDHYDFGKMINSGELLIFNENRIWLRFKGEEGNKRFICVINNDGSKYVEVAESIPRPRNIIIPIPPPILCGETGIALIPKQSQFPDHRIQNGGSCFLCACVKGGLTNKDQCMDCFNWGVGTGKLNSSNCYVNIDKESWAREISIRYLTPYHSDYCYQRNNNHFWLTQNGREIFNSFGIGWRE